MCKINMGIFQSDESFKNNLYCYISSTKVHQHRERIEVF